MQNIIYFERGKHMEEILKKIEEEVNFIKEEKKELEKLTVESKNAQDEKKKAEEEMATISNKESGFYKDLSEKVAQKDKTFREIDIKRMNKDREINKLVSERKELILKDLEAKKQYIDENRNANLQGVNLEELKSEKEKLEKEIKLNDTTREEFDKMSDSEKQEVRKAKENYLNNKHRLDEITPTIELMETLDGKEPKDKFIEIEGLIKTIEDKFNKDDLDEVLKTIGDKTEKDIEQQNEEKEDIEESKDTEKKSDEQQKNSEEKEEQEAESTQIYREEPVNIYNPNYKISEQKEQQGNQQIKEEKNKIVLDISRNKIKVNGNENLFYKEEAKNKEDIIKQYGIGSYFLNDKKAKKNIDYALISTLEKIDDKDGSLVEAYLKVIRDGNTQNEEVKESIEKLNKAVDIEYKFSKENGILTNLREKRLARNAKKLGIASLDGISEKSLSDKIKDMFSKIKNAKLPKGKDKPKALASGENARAQEQKRKTIDLINKDREQLGIRSRVKVENKDNRIEKIAQETQKEAQEQIGKEVQDIKKQEEEQK